MPFGRFGASAFPRVSEERRQRLPQGPLQTLGQLPLQPIRRDLPQLDLQPVQPMGRPGRAELIHHTPQHLLEDLVMEATEPIEQRAGQGPIRRVDLQFQSI